MFDIGFSELFIIMLVGLLVIGPERLPKVARTLGAMLGRLQRYVNDVKADINREVELEELRKMKTEFEQAARSVEQSVSDELRQTETDLNRTIAPPENPTESTSQDPAMTHQDSAAPEAPARAATGAEETRA
jgi:sec-independent protein translocase protein TatB